MDRQTVFAFGSVVGALVITPGAGFVIFVETMTSKGRRQAALLFAGMLGGMMIVAATIIACYPVIVGCSEGLARLIRLAGGTYLVLLGARNGYRATRRDHAPVSVHHEAPLARHARFVEGAITSLTNPGVFLIYVVIMPTFIVATNPWRPTATLLAVVHLTLTTAWYTVLFVALGVTRHLLGSSSAQRRLTLVAALALVVIGVRTLLSA